MVVIIDENTMPLLNEMWMGEQQRHDGGFGLFELLLGAFHGGGA